MSKNFIEIFTENNFIFIVDENKIIFSITRSVLHTDEVEVWYGYSGAIQTIILSFLSIYCLNGSTISP